MPVRSVGQRLADFVGRGSRRRAWEKSGIKLKDLADFAETDFVSGAPRIECEVGKLA